MKFRHIFILLLLGVNTGSGDFSDANFQLHPFSPEGRPYILDLTGEWPTDCHPGEQKPVIRSYTGDSALIEFEIIVDHVTCNDVPTPYRVLVDMSDVMDGTQESPASIAVTLRYAGTEFTKELDLICICSPSRRPPLNPEAGLYFSEGLQNQGLILARQNQRLAVYPLIYDDLGSSEWLFGGGGIDEEVYFANLHELTNGQCLGCPPPGDPPQLDVVGKLSMLMDREGIIQVKINDGLFTEYRPLEFGYGSLQIWDPIEQVEVKVPNLSGHWAFSDATKAATSSTPTLVLPLVFDIKLRELINPPPPTTGPIPGPMESVVYGLVDMEMKLVAEMTCKHSGELSCELHARDRDAPDEIFDVQVLSIERMYMRNTATPDQGQSAGSGTVVRVD